MRIFFTALFLFVIITNAGAQEMLGIANSNYAGTNGLSLNPSSMVDSRLRFDLNIITLGVSADNDYVYIPKSQLTFFGIKNSSHLVRDTGYSDAKNFDINNLSKNYKAYASGLLRIPSALFHIKDNYFALTFSGRTAMTISNLPAPLAKFAYEGGFKYGPLLNTPFSFNDMSLKLVSWGEIGISYGHDLINNGADYLNGAITIKRLLPLYSGYINASATDATSLQFGCDTCDALIAKHSTIDYGIPIKQNDSTSGGIRGGGWGFDIGFTYEYRPEHEQHYYKMDGQTLIDPTYNQYKWKVGFSLLDLGKMTVKNSAVYHLDGVPYVARYETIKTNIAELNKQLSAYYYNGDSGKSYQKSEYDMALPHAMSLQVDYHIGGKFYSNLTWMYAIQSNTGPTAQNLLALVPRYERKNIELSMPITLYDYDKLHLGLAFRVFGLVIGSDKIGPLLGLADMSGMDAYLSLKIPLNKRRIKDRDDDGVSDKMDRCPDVKGPWEALGCPDRDGDGIADVDDSCPDVKGLPQFHGCPDTDGDGIPDRLDSCPTVAGLSQFHGCPDTDGDGIPDPQDSCPTLAGLMQFHGCPDTDGDGIPDPQDSCPTVAGLMQFHGCPDTDGDGIPDPQDSCPTVAGPASNHGCPIIKKEPVKVELNKEEQEVINKVFSNLEFETGKWVIRSSSYKSLDDLVALLKKKPTFKLLIDGHTDNVGSAASNMRLSKNRADAVKTYLVNKGIDPARITAKGYGLTRPIASNKTAEGRQKNRRVEFTIVE